jgi:hypothetical protein
MKILLLVEDIAKISQLLRQDSNLKVIDEHEMVEETSFNNGLAQPKYSDYVVDRARVLSVIYNYRKTLCIVLDQRHKNSVDKIPHDVSIRVCKSVKPRRLSDSFTQKVDKIFLEDEFTIAGLVA